MVYNAIKGNYKDFGGKFEDKPAYRDFRAGDVRHSLADITRARTLLGYEPEYDVRQGLRLAGDWYDAHL